MCRGPLRPRGRHCQAMRTSIGPRLHDGAATASLPQVGAGHAPCLIPAHDTTALSVAVPVRGLAPNTAVRFAKAEVRKNEGLQVAVRAAGDGEMIAASAPLR